MSQLSSMMRQQVKLTVTGGNGETFQLPMPAELPTYSLKVVDGKIQLLDGDKVVSEAPLPTTDAPAAFDPTLLKLEQWLSVLWRCKNLRCRETSKRWFYYRSER